MLQYITKRILLAILTLFIITGVSYLLLRLTPGTPVRSSMLDGENGGGANLASDKGEFAENVSLKKKLYLDRPVYIGFFYWLKGILTRFDFGDSAAIEPGRPVTELIMERLPVTLTLNVLALLVTYLLAIPLGVFTAIKADSFFDRSVTFFLFFLYSLPVIWVALLLQTMLCQGGMLPVFPLRGLTVDHPDSLNAWQLLGASAKHYILPVACLCYAGFAGISRFARGGMLDVIGQDYIRTARAKGMPESLVIFKHALRNGMITLVTLFAGLLPGLVAGSIIVEFVFSIPGMGQLSFQALGSRDYPVQMALFCFGGFLTLAGILFSDLLYVIVDPRITFSDRRG